MRLLQAAGVRPAFLIALIAVLGGAGILLAVPSIFPSPDPLPPAAAGPLSCPVPTPVVREGRVRQGDTLFAILRAGGVPEEDATRAARARADGRDLARVVTGRPYRFLLEGSRVAEYQYEPDGTRLLRLIFAPGGPVASMEAIPVTVVPVAVKGVIEDNLFGAIEGAGEDPALALDLSEVFAWQVDFFRDIRKGDSFNVLVEKVLRDGRFLRYGDILAAEFVNGGRRFTAFSWTDASGRRDYFDEGGASLRKEFLKAPLRFRRISSSFSYRRRHPVTRTVRAHLGTDYAAPVGTPVRAIGDGRVTEKRADSANGRMIKLRHNGTYSSAYAHLNSWAAGLGVGSAVRQGDIIGFVGSSGLSTGPHLHFVLYRNGQMVDSRRAEAPPAAALAEAEREGFFRAVADRQALLGMAPGAGKVAAR
jgi:murein DD-endopeptidase MepM/ murein hydrolase activator NlpD